MRARSTQKSIEPLKTRAFENGDTTTYTFDKIGRLSSRVTPAINESFFYDESTYGIGRSSVRATRSSGTTMRSPAGSAA
jgi:hypothetical protein